MRAAVYYETGPPDVLQYQEVPDPACSQSGLVIDVKAISIEGGDVLNRAGGSMTGRPQIVGYQCAGVVHEVGENVTDFVRGERVVAVMEHGSHATKASAAPNTTWRVPDGLDLKSAACVPLPFGTADDCLFEFGHLQQGEIVLVQAGAGGVGLAAVQLAKRGGATVMASASTQAKVEKLRAYGVDCAINYATTDLVSAVREFTNGRGVDLVIDSVGGKILEVSRRCLTYRGRAITVGNASRDTAQIDFRGLRIGSQSLTGVYFLVEMQTARMHRIIANHLNDVRTGTLKVVIDRTFALSEAAAAHAHVESRRAFGRVLLVPDGAETSLE